MDNCLNPCILAMYDIRGKQDYIYKRNKIKEIVGASLLIRDCFIDYLFPAAEAIEGGGKGIFSYRVKKEKDHFFYKSDEEVKKAEKFSENAFSRHMEEGYIAEVVYDGGGNFFVIFKNHDLYVKTNQIFYKKLMEETGSLRVLTSYVENIHFNDYKSDEKRLREVHRRAEQRECLLPPVNTLPIVQTDYMSSMPLVEKGKKEWSNADAKLSRDSFAKYEKYSKFRKSDQFRENDVTKLDQMIEKKGEDSHLAVIYIDGNSMGAKVQAQLNDRTSYEECVNALRDFSTEIQERYISNPMKAIDEKLKSLPKYRENCRFIVYAGDEITFICNAHAAYEIVNTYFQSLPDGGKGKHTSCAGVAIFHSHAPYADAYRIAEECCESGKKRMKGDNPKGIVMENACFLDFHYCQGAIGTSLEHIRAFENTEELCEPWLLYSKAGESMEPSGETIGRMQELLHIIARSNNKTLFYAAQNSNELYQQEVERIIVHCLNEEDQKKLQENRDFLKENRKLLYRMMLVYDLWFRK